LYIFALIYAYNNNNNVVLGEGSWDCVWVTVCIISPATSHEERQATTLFIETNFVYIRSVTTSIKGYPVLFCKEPSIRGDPSVDRCILKWRIRLEHDAASCDWYGNCCSFTSLMYVCSSVQCDADETVV